MMDEKEEIAFIAVVMQMCYQYLKLHKQKKRSWWVRPLYQERSTKRLLQTTSFFKFINDNDEDFFFKATHLTKLQYDLLLSLVERKLKKKSIRKPISPENRIIVTLMYLTQGVSTNYLASTFRMGKSTVRKIIVEVCEVLWDVLSPNYMPKCNIEDWKEISLEFNNHWNMPHCVGSIDGKHIEIKRPPNSGSKYINYKRYFSIVLFAVCDANHTFTVVDVEPSGGQSDGGFFRNSSFGKQIFLNEAQLPAAEKLPNSEQVAPYYFVADSAFPLRDNLMRPYPGTNLDIPEEVFNCRISKGLRIAENTFGLLAARWKILTKRIEFHPLSANKIILACTILHNFIKTTDIIFKSNTYSPEGYCDFYDNNGKRTDGMWRQETHNLLSVRKCGSNNRTKGASEVRKTLTNYFLNESQVSYLPK